MIPSLRFLAAGGLASLTLVACGGGGQVRSREHHHHHHHHQGGLHPDASVTEEVVGSPRLAAVMPSRPGLAHVPVTLSGRLIKLSAPSSGADPSGSRSFSRRITSAPAGAVVHLASGDYPELLDHVQRHGWVTVSGAGDSTEPIVAGARFLGASRVRLVDVQFSRGIRIAHLVAGGSARHSRNIQILDSDIDCGASSTVKGKAGVNVRGASEGIVLSGDEIHDCVVGFTSAAGDNYSRDIAISHCLFSSIYGDAIDLGGVDGVEITNNEISGVHRTPGSIYHDDEIQFFGNTANVVIAYNVERDSTDQMIFIQDAAKNRYDGSSLNQQILVLGNLIYGAGALAVQDQGGVAVALIGNTIWDGKDGSLLVRRSPYTHIIPTHTLLADNIIQRLSFRHVPRVLHGYNVLGAPAGLGRASADVIRAGGGLDSPDTGRFTLSDHSPARGSAAPVSWLVAMARRAGADSAILRLIAAYHAVNRGSPIAENPAWDFGAPDKVYPVPG